MPVYENLYLFVTKIIYKIKTQAYSLTSFINNYTLCNKIYLRTLHKTDKKQNSNLYKILSTINFDVIILSSALLLLYNLYYTNYIE